MIQTEFPPDNDSGSVSLSDTAETLVLSAIGSLSCCDVWFRVPEDWPARVTLRLYGRLGSARVLLREVPLSHVPVTPAGAEPAQLSGIAVSLRGQPVRAYEVSCAASAGPALSEGYFYLQAWHDQSGLAVSGRGSGGALSPAVSARLVGRTSTGSTAEVTSSTEGRVRVLGTRP